MRLRASVAIGAGGDLARSKNRRRQWAQLASGEVLERRRGCNLKPFIVTQRVRRPPGKGGARHPEASLAWVLATVLVKRRQQVLKPCGSLEIMVTLKPSVCWDPGAISGNPRWPGRPIRPGS